ncbi:MAG: Tfp pilus assembly protein PilF [Cocleimonas sp.]|jgi:Tfp pilus assembly protein PilF
MLINNKDIVIIESTGVLSAYDLHSTIAKAVTFHKQGKIEKAYKVYRKILKSEPNNADVLNYLGMLEFQRGNYDQGIKLIERCLKIYPYHAAGCNNLANMYMTTYNIDKAEVYYIKSIEMDNRAVQPLYNLGIIEKIDRIMKILKITLIKFWH